MKIKQIVAVVVGIGANLLAIPVDLILESLGIFSITNQSSGEGQFVLALLYRAAFAMLGGYMTAHLAPIAPMRHAWILGSLGALLASLGAIGQWHLGHHWYALSIIAMSLPATCLGAYLAVKNKA